MIATGINIPYLAILHTTVINVLVFGTNSHEKK